MRSIARLIERACAQVRGAGDLGAVIRAGGVALVIRLAAACAAYASAVALARWMGAAEFGVYSYVWAWTVLLAIPAGLGLPSANVRFLPTYLAAGDAPRARSLVATSSWLTLGAASGLATAGLLAAAALGAYIAPDQLTPLTIALAAIPFVAMVTLKSETARGLGWIVLAYAPSLLAIPILVLALAYAVFRIAGTLQAIDVMIVTIAAHCLVLIGQAAAVRHRLAPTIGGAKPRSELRAWLAVGGPVVLISGFMTVLLQSDVVMVGLLLDSSDVAHYTAAARTAFLINFVLQAANVLAAGRFAVLHAQGKTGELQALLSGLINWMFWPSLALVVAIVVAGHQVLAIFGPSFPAGYWPLVLLSGAQLIGAATGPVPVLLNMTGHQTVCAKVLGIAAACQVLLNAVLIPLYGTVGAALGTLFATALWNVWLLVIVIRRLGVQPSIVPLRASGDRYG